MLKSMSGSDEVANLESRGMGEGAAGGLEPERGPRGWWRLTAADQTIQALFLIAFLIGLVVFFDLRSDGVFLTKANVISILATAGVIGIVTVGQTFTIISGGFDLSVTGVVPLGGVIFTLLLNAHHGIGLALPLTMLLGALIGCGNGAIIAWGKINPLITTLATMSITAGAALSAAGGVDIPFADYATGVLADQSAFEIPNQVWIFLGCIAGGAVVLRYTVFGRYLYAVGGNAEASHQAGIQTQPVTMSVYALSGGLASLAGAILASELLTGVGTGGSDSALSSIAAAVLGGAALGGGIGGMGGTLVGVLLLGSLANGLSILHVASFYQQIATGAVLLLAVGISQARMAIRGARLGAAR